MRWLPLSLLERWPHRLRLQCSQRGWAGSDPGHQVGRQGGSEEPWQGALLSSGICLGLLCAQLLLSWP